jgi:hypothetical protein
MNNDINNFIKQASDQIPKGGAWITLKNIQLAINIAIDTMWQVIKLGLALAGIYYLYTITPLLQSMIESISK